MTYQMRNWDYFNWLCGDHIVEQHIHNIDVINWTSNIQLMIQRALSPAKISSESLVYSAKSGSAITSPEHRRRACAIGMAENTPYRRAS